MRYRSDIIAALTKSRYDARKSQQDMADHFGYSLRTIQNWEYGERMPSALDFLNWFYICDKDPMYYINNIYEESKKERETLCKSLRSTDKETLNIVKDILVNHEFIDIIKKIKKLPANERAFIIKMINSI